jgi:phenylalanyl-tRNA synthetase beta chain
MQASIKWLKEYVDFKQTPEVLADMLTMAGIPVEGITYLGKDIEKIVTGRIVEIEKHPNATKLSICKLDVGNETLIIVTGATNVCVGNVVPVALVGAKLPTGLEIKASELRGVMSYGMLCSTAELNIDSKLLTSKEKEGIYILSEDTAVGIDIREALGMDDVVLEFELTANRADCFSLIGLAREIAVLTGGTLKKPMIHLHETAEGKTANLVKVSIEEPSLCSRFAVRVLQNVKVAPSPKWLKHRLQAVGMRSINNVVDVTNYVMLEMGQPMHAYDYNLVSKHNLTVRKAQPGEKITTLDGIKRELTSDMLVIADQVQAVGIAGVMGGLATEVTTNTQNVILEAASFNGVSIRRTSRVLGLRSEASGRFERGVDTANSIRALDRAAKLLEDMGACKVCPGIVDSYPNMLLPRQVSFMPQKVNAYLGTNLDKSVMLDILRRLEFAIDTHSEGDNIIVNVPTWRGDVQYQPDICEEIARIYGYNNIPTTTPGGNILRGGQEHVQSIVDSIKTILTGIGLDEIISLSFSHPQILHKLNIAENSALHHAITVLNPITDDFPILRTTLLGGVLETIVRNISRKNDDIKIYELGAVYLPEELPLQSLPQEPLMLCGALVGKRNEFSWNQGKDLVDFYDAKGIVEVLLTGLGIADYEVIPGEHVSLHPGKTASFIKDGNILATVGELHPKVADDFSIQRKVYIFEANIETLVNYVALLTKYESLPKFPAINRDLAVVLPLTVSADEVTQAIVDNAGPLLSDVRLFDVYVGEQVADGFKSLAFSLIYRDTTRTLTDEEIEVCYKNTVDHLERTLAAKIRS